MYVGDYNIDINYKYFIFIYVCVYKLIKKLVGFKAEGSLGK